MQRSLLSWTVLGVVASVALTQVAFAQPAPKDDHPAAARAEEHKAPTAAHAEHKAPAAAHHATRAVKNTHVNETVNEHVNKTVVTHAAVGRPVVGPGHSGGARWARGARFDGPRVAYTEWGRYHLRQPPAGYEWVQDGDELVLINLGSGLIDDTFIITVP